MPCLWIRVILVLTIVTSSSVYLQERSPRESWLARSVSPGQCEAQSGLRPWAPRRRPPGQAWFSVTLAPAHVHTGRSLPAPVLPSSLPPSPHPVLSRNGMQLASPLKGEGGVPCHPQGFAVQPMRSLSPLCQGWEFGLVSEVRTQELQEVNAELLRGRR